MAAQKGNTTFLPLQAEHGLKEYPNEQELTLAMEQLRRFEYQERIRMELEVMQHYLYRSTVNEYYHYVDEVWLRSTINSYLTAWYSRNLLSCGHLLKLGADYFCYKWIRVYEFTIDAQKKIRDTAEEMISETEVQGALNNELNASIAGKKLDLKIRERETMQQPIEKIAIEFIEKGGIVDELREAEENKDE